KPKDPQFRSRVEATLNRQQVMKTLGVTIASLQPGEIELVMPYDAAYTQQHGCMLALSRPCLTMHAALQPCHLCPMMRLSSRLNSRQTCSRREEVSVSYLGAK